MKNNRDISVEAYRQKLIAEARFKCENSLLYFTQLFFQHTMNREFSVKTHHKIMAEGFESTVAGKIRRLIINVPPRYSKTEMSINYVAWGLALNPQAKFLLLSYSDDLVSDNSSRIKDIINSELFQELWPGVKLKKDTRSKKKWYTDQGGGVYATSLKGQITGFGAGTTAKENDEEESEIHEFGGTMIIDDPIKPEEGQESSKIREAVNNRYNRTLSSRLNSEQTPVILIMQRLHPEDLAGFLIGGGSGEKWENIMLKAIQDDGSPLWPAKHSLEALQNMRLADEDAFDTQYQQNPQPAKGIFFPKPLMKRYKQNELPEKFDKIISFVDVADTGTDSLSMPIVGISLNPTVRFFLFDVIFNQDNIEINQPRVIEKIENTPCDMTTIETNKEGRLFMLNVKKATRRYVRGVLSKGNKMRRVAMQSGYIIDHFYFPETIPLNSPMDKFFKQLCATRKDGGSDHDDAADSLAGLANEARTQLHL